MEDTQVVAVGLVTANDLTLLGPSSRPLYHVDDVPCFARHLQAMTKRIAS